jgi:hypothetical protein
MKKALILSVFAVFINCLTLSGQEYTASGYFKMERDPSFLNLQRRLNAGELLSVEEQTFMTEYKARLFAYFNQMSDQEKALYYQNRVKWAQEPGAVNQEEESVYSGERSTYSRYLVASGFFGAFYGVAVDAILGIDGPAAAGIPLITGGLSVVIPAVSIRDKKVSTNSLLLSTHGKMIGAFQGAMLGVLISGKNVDEEGYGKLTLGLVTASSIALGRVGYNLGRYKNWTPGRVSLYSHYGWLMPLEGLAIVAAFESENPRLYAASSLLFGAGGYVIADRVADKNNFTRGDVIAMESLSAFTTLLGFGILADIEPENGSAFLVPAAGALAGTFIGQRWVRNAGLTLQQGRNVALAHTGGAVVGLGIAAIINSESPPIWYIIPYSAGLATYAFALESYKKKNSMTSVVPEKTRGWNINLMPQNILLNQKLISSGRIQAGKRYSMLPAFSASVRF